MVASVVNVTLARFDPNIWIHWVQHFGTTNPVSFGRYNSMFPPLRSEKKGFGPTKNPKNLRKMFKIAELPIVALPLSV